MCACMRAYVFANACSTVGPTVNKRDEQNFVA